MGKEEREGERRERQERRERGENAYAYTEVYKSLSFDSLSL